MDITISFYISTRHSNIQYSYTNKISILLQPYLIKKYKYFIYISFTNIYNI